MKIRCESCNKKFDPKKHDGVCPYCGAWNSIGAEDRIDPPAPAIDPWDLPQRSAEETKVSDPDAPGQESGTPFTGIPAQEEHSAPPHSVPHSGGMPPVAPPPSGAQGPAPRRGCGPLFFVAVLLFVLSVAVFLLLPPFIEARVTARAVAQDRIGDLTVIEAQDGAAVAAPFSYRLADAHRVDYNGVWPIPEGETLLRVELAVSMSGGKPEWDPTDPYLRLDDGSYRMAIYGYDIRELFPEDADLLSAFPYDVYYLETPSDAASCVFYYLVPQQCGEAVLCFESYAQGDYEAYLTQVTELPFVLPEEVSAE